MKTLNSILLSNNITTYNLFDEYVKSENSEVEILIDKDIKNYDLSEGRIFEDTVEFEKKFVTVDMLNLRDPKKIIFKDCIFAGEVHISMHTESITILNCIFLDILNISSDNSKLDIFSSGISMLNIQCNIDINISYCNIYKLRFQNANIKSRCFFNNNIEHFSSFATNYIGEIFDYSQINMKYLTNIKCFGQENFNKDYLFQSVVNINHVNIENVLNNTLDFIIQNTNIKYDKQSLNKLIYSKTYNSQIDNANKFLVKISGGFCKPSIWFLYAFMVVIIFSFLYLIPAFQFNIQENLTTMPNLLKSLYFSCVTFISIGHETINPVYFSKILVVIESLLGIIIIDSLLVSLVKKYTD